MGSPASPSDPPYGHRLLVQLIDELAQESSGRLYSESPLSGTVEDGFKQTTYGELANAINAMAWWIERELGKGIDFPTLAYLGPPDLRYPILVIAAQKAGYKVYSMALLNCSLLTSNRRSYLLQEIVSMLICIC